MKISDAKRQAITRRCAIAEQGTSRRRRRQPSPGALFEHLVASDDVELRRMDYHSLLEWAANDDGVLVRSRLLRIARVRGYNKAWVVHNFGRHWRDVLAQARRWRLEHG